LRNFFKRYGYFIFPAAVLLIILAVKNMNGISVPNGYYLMHYLFNYSHGFMTRGFIGHVISLFTDTVTPGLASGLQFSFSVLLLISASVCISIVLKKTDGDRKIYAFVVMLLVLIVFHPQSFAMYFESSYTDKLMIALTLIAVLFAERKHLIWLVPSICLLCTLISIYYSLHSMILIAIVLLQKFYDSRYSIKNGAVCLLSYGLIIAVSIYGMSVMYDLSFGSPEEMCEYFLSRYTGDPYSTVQWYVDTVFVEYFFPMLSLVKDNVQNDLSFHNRFWELVFDLSLLYIPMFAACGYFWFKSLKNSENKFQKFIFFLCLISPVLTLLPVFLSLEYERHFEVNIQMQICICFYYLAKKNDAATSAAARIYDFFAANRQAFYLSAAYFITAVGLL
jgi:hypothetical protein